MSFPGPRPASAISAARANPPLTPPRWLPKTPAEWDPERPDENTGYYLKRLDEFAGKFRPFFEEHDFRLVFSPEDLFGFSAAGIEIVSRHTGVEEPGDEVPF